MAYASAELHTKPDAAAHAAQAAGVATTMSSPCLFSGDAAARTSSGRSERPAEGGKATSSAKSVPAAAASADVALHLVDPKSGGRGASAQPPAVAAVVDASDQQVQAPHPAVAAAAGVQQHPPRHAKEPQSKAPAHASPGGPATHAPVGTPQALHPARMATAEQHTPPRHWPLAQDAPE